MLVGDGRSLVADGADRADREGFSAGARQFDSDITAGRYPRAALGLSDRQLIAVVCDGRADDEAGLAMAELAVAMIGLGAGQAINLDGGGSASLVVGGSLVNTPREDHGIELAGGRAVATALHFAPRLSF
jgi:exopolysaccharide biosynthesis protein